MTTIGSKSRSNKDKSVDSEKSAVRTATMESWADAMQNQVTLRERKKLVKGYADFIGTSETVVESVREQLGVHSKCSERQKDVIVKPMKEFVSELTKRYNELGSGKWERVVMRIMRENGLEKLEDLRDREQAEFEENLERTSREKELLVEKLEEAWRAAEKAEETIEELERALLKERKTSEKWKSQWEREGKKKEIQSRNKEKIQVHSRRSSSRSSNGSSVNNWEVKSSVGDFPRVSERRKCERDSERCSRVSRDSSRMDLERKQKQPMWEFLMSVEKWSKRAFPHLEEETLSQLRVTKLMRALRDDPTMQKLMTMKRYEVAKKDQYEFLKDIVLQQENEDKRRQGLGKSDRHEKKENSWKKEKSKEVKQGDTETEKNGSEDSSHGNRSESSDQWRASIKCYKCQVMGHIARDCDAKVIHHVETDGTGSGVGAKMREQVELLGQKRIMVIDSGAEVSVMSTKVWDALKKGCVNWRQRVEVLTKPVFALRNASGKKMPVKEQLKMPIMVRGNKAEVWFQLVEDRAEILLLGTNAFESIGVELAWKPKQEERVKKEGKGPKAKWERNAERAKCETSSATVNHIMTEGNVVEYNHFCRKLMEEGGGCKKGKCTVQEGDNVCSSVQQLGVVLSAKGKGVDLEKGNLLKYSKEFQAQMTTVEKEEALQKFAKECPQVAEAIRKEGAYAGWEEAAVKIRLALKSEIKPRKTIIKEPALIVSPRLKISGRRNILEVRNSHGRDFIEKYEWKDVKNVLWLWRVTKDEKVNQKIFEMIKKLAEEVPEVTMMPCKLECVMKEVDAVTEDWRKRLKTLNNVKLIDPKKEVGKRKMPLIGTSSDAYESKESLIDRAAEKSQTTLLGRYTVFIRARAVMISKGYIAQLEETN
ncbi:Protein CBG08916 [Caenorhabditis briggsae]|uniref:Protein CBG08916 n=1 Tax=Caenorhabditis briggsae TaxID=6238 RepID=A8X7P2_CAEBR|nr:Protein CBG08916 [Caenorhabditis briggsae]CAP28653.2 Protein CBG08916 [Caenorhabditis briggsae]